MSYTAYQLDTSKRVTTQFHKFVNSKYELATQFIKQYIKIKQKHLEYLVFFRIGDFFELFFDDAVIAHKELNIFLTKKNTKAEAIDMCGIPHHALDNHVNKLIKLGYRVAICDQIIDDSNEAKLIVGGYDYDSYLSNDLETDQLDDKNFDQPAKNELEISKEINSFSKNNGSADAAKNNGSAAKNDGLSTKNNDAIKNDGLSTKNNGSADATKNDDAEASKLIKRKIVRIITPGTITAESVLDSTVPNYLVSIYQSVTNELEENLLDQSPINKLARVIFYISYADVNTGEINIISCNENRLLSQLAVIGPREILLSETQSEIIKKLQPYYSLITMVSAPPTRTNLKHKRVIDSIFNKSKTATSLNNFEENALSMILQYIDFTRLNGNLSLPQKLGNIDTFPLDHLSIHHLEILKNYNGTKHNSLFDVLNKTYTKPGARLLRQFILNPLKDKFKIIKRQDYVAILNYEFKNNIDLILKLTTMLQNFGDIDSLLTKLNSRSFDIRNTIQTISGISQCLVFYNKIQEVILLFFNNYQKLKYKDILESVEKHLFAEDPNARANDKLPKRESLNIVQHSYQSTRSNNVDRHFNFKEILKIIPEYRELIDFIAKMIDINEGALRHDAHPKLAKLKNEQYECKNDIFNLQDKYKKMLSENNLKVMKHSLIKYCVEIPSKSVAKFNSKTFEKFIPKQNTGIVSRFKTLELEEIEQKLGFLESSIADFEKEIIKTLINKLIDSSELMRESGRIIAHIDVFLSYAVMANEYKYSRPKFSTNDLLIQNGRHPVLENLCSNFKPNDICIKNEVIVITGPNMGGKTTFLRQVAIITLMYQIGSFVPADHAEIPIVDQIFTRIGSNDSPTQGQSTFMKEMSEINYILYNSTKNSLILLDEIGRGTANTEGMVLAFSILEYIYKHLGAKCILATHYHKIYDMIKMFNVQIECKFYFTNLEINEDGIKFLYSLMPGVMSQPYGISVAQITGMNHSIVKSAKFYFEKLNN